MLILWLGFPSLLPSTMSWLLCFHCLLISCSRFSCSLTPPLLRLLDCLRFLLCLLCSLGYHVLLFSHLLLFSFSLYSFFFLLPFTPSLTTSSSFPPSHCTCPPFPMLHPSAFSSHYTLPSLLFSLLLFLYLLLSYTRSLFCCACAFYSPSSSSALKSKLSVALYHVLHVYFDVITI